MTDTDTPDLGLTDEDYRNIRQITEYASEAFTDTVPPDDLADQDGHGLTVGQCNAIRAAAADGHSSRYIADLFGFLDDPTTANDHATGSCQHGQGDHPAALPALDPDRE